MSEPASAYLTTAETAERLRVARDHVLALIRKGDLPAINISLSTRSKRPRFRIPVADLDRFIAARSVPHRRYSRPPRRQPYRKFF